MNQSITVNVTLDRELYDKASEEAFRRRTNMAGLIEIALNEMTKPQKMGLKKPAKKGKK